MLEVDYQHTLDAMLDRLPCYVAMPRDWNDFFSREGLLPTVANDRRQFPRRHFCESAVMEFGRSLPAIHREKALVAVYTKDISVDSIGILSPAQMFPGETFILWTSIGKMSAEVARCRKLNDACFEVGCKTSEV